MPIPPSNPNKPSEAAAGDGALERFIAEFNRFEAEERLFERCVDPDGLAWWDLARYTIQFALCVDCGIHGRRHEAPPAHRKRLRSVAARASRLILDSIKFASLSGHEATSLYVFGRSTTPLLTALNRDRRRHVVIANDPSVRIAVGKRSLELLSWLAAPLSRVPPTVAGDACQIDALLKARFASQLDFRTMIESKYKRHRADRVIWSHVLGKLPQLKTLNFVNDDTLKTLLALAHNRGIRSREFQHGYMGRSHVGYSYPPLARRLATLPDEIQVHRDSGDISMPVPLVMSDVTPVQFEREYEPRDIDVLVGGSPTRNREAQAIVAALVNRGWKVAIKLHPAQTVAASGMRRLFSQDQLEIHAGEEDFQALARRSWLYVPANPTSTTSFEAVERGAKLIVIDYEGQKLTSALDRIATDRVNSPEELAAVVRARLSADRRSAAAVASR